MEINEAGTESASESIAPKSSRSFLSISYKVIMSFWFLIFVPCILMMLFTIALGFHWVFGALYFLIVSGLLIGFLKAMWGETTDSNYIEEVIAKIFVTSGFLIASFAILSYALYMADLADYELTTEAPDLSKLFQPELFGKKIDPICASFIWMHYHSLLDLLPFLDAAKILEVESNLKADSLISRLLMLAFRATVAFGFLDSASKLWRAAKVKT